MEYDFSKSDECIKWLNYKYIVLGRNLYRFLSGAEQSKELILQSEECAYHFKDIIDRLQILYRMVAGEELDERPVLDLSFSIDGLFKKNWLEIMTTDNPVEAFEKPVLTDNQDFRPLGFTYPFSGWFHEKSSYLAESFVYVTCYLYDNNLSMFGTGWVECVKESTMVLRELLDFFTHSDSKYPKNNLDLPDGSIEEFFFQLGFKKEVVKYDPDSEYWKEEKAIKGVNRFLKKWDKLIKIPLENGGRTLLYDAFDNLGFKDIRIGELRNELDRVSMGEKKWGDFLEESRETIKELKDRPYDPFYYGYESYEEREEAIDAEERRKLFEY